MKRKRCGRKNLNQQRRPHTHSTKSNIGLADLAQTTEKTSSNYARALATWKKNDHSITTKIVRLNSELSSLRNGQYYVTLLNDIAEWGRNILETKSKATKRKRTLTRQIRDECIKQQVQRIINSFASEPRKFSRKIR
jgi:hypothetical protein